MANSTIPMASLLSSPTGTINSYTLYAEIVLHITSFAPFMAATFGYFRPKKAKMGGWPYQWMVAHVLCSQALLIKYYVMRCVTGQLVSMDKVDAALATIFIFSAIQLEETRAKAQTKFYRAGFRASIVLHGMVFLLAAIEKDAFLFQSAIKYICWFASFRWSIRALGYFIPELKEPKHYKRLLELTMITSGSFALWYASLPVGWYVVLLLGMLGLDKVEPSSRNTQDC